MSRAEFSKLHGDKAKVDPKAHPPQTTHDLSSNSPIDWRNLNAVNEIKDQGSCGSCWTFAAVAVLEGAYAINKGNLRSFAEQELVDCCYDYDGCNGGDSVDAFKWWMTNSAISEDDYAYTAEGGVC